MGRKNHIRERIISLLRKCPEGLPILKVAELVGVHRHTVTKYVYELVGADVIQIREIGTAKVCFLKERFAKRREKKLLEKLRKRVGVKRGKPLASIKLQSELLPILLVVVFFLTVATVSASQSITGLFASNESNLDEPINTGFNVENLVVEESPASEVVLPLTEAVTSQEDRGQSAIENDVTFPDVLTNETGTTPTENITLNESVEITSDENKTAETNENFTNTPPENTTNATIPEIPSNEAIPSAEEDITIEDNSPPTYSNLAVNNTNPKIGEAIEFSVFWQDDFGLDKWIFSWNAFGSWENETYSFISSYDKNTQILTKEGWKYLKDLDYRDEIATLYNKEIVWEKPLRILSLPYDNGIYKIDGEIDLFVTPDHQVFARVDNTLSFLLNRIKDFFFGIDIEDFKFINIQEAYELTKNGYHLTFLDDKLNPVFINRITKESYKGEIFDLTVPNHIVLVKRFGKAVWSSNLNVKEVWSNITKVIPVTGSIGYRFYASDLAGNWKETEIGTIEVKELDISENITVPNISEIILNVNVESPQKITRGEVVSVKATITNTGLAEAKNVSLIWKLPAGSEIISGNQTENCGNLEPNASCVSVITVQTSLSTELGINEIKVVVSYE